MKWLIRGVVLLAAVYGSALGGVYWLMRQPPEQFAAGIARLPRISMMALPFEPLWMRARAGRLKVGETAPDFELPTLDKSARVRLSSFRGDKPVLLVFGSYT
ncbi:MAG TPA: hypothetical protein VFL57_20540 [Bryobacteraceae bacterium]|nr:hypothetical protein [Bryobacteraceae bacterium]